MSKKKKGNARLGVCQAVESLYLLIPLCPSSQLVNLVDISSVKNNLKLKLRNNIELKQIQHAGPSCSNVGERYPTDKSLSGG